MITLSPSQESEDTISSRNTWTLSSTSRTTLTRTSQTNLPLRTSSQLPSKLRKPSTRSTMTESSLTQLTSIHRPIIPSPGPPPTSERATD